MPTKILYADDEAQYRRLVKMFLEESGYDVLTVSNGEEVMDALYADNEIKLVILDVMMPMMDGWETCKAIRQMSHVPILMLTALDDVENEVFGIENGADDYIAKPFSHERLIARIKGLLRRVRIECEDKFSDEGITLDETCNSVLFDGVQISLFPKEFDLFKYLVSNKGRVLTRDQILDHVWGYTYFGDRRTVDTHIKSLRAKLGEKSKRIVTLRNKGYCYRGEES